MIGIAILLAGASFLLLLLLHPTGSGGAEFTALSALLIAVASFLVLTWGLHA